MTDVGYVPRIFRGHKSTFYVKCASNGSNLIASGSQNSMVCIWDTNMHESSFNTARELTMQLGST